MRFHALTAAVLDADASTRDVVPSFKSSTEWNVRRRQGGRRLGPLMSGRGEKTRNATAALRSVFPICVPAFPSPVRPSISRIIVCPLVLSRGSRHADPYSPCTRQNSISCHQLLDHYTMTSVSCLLTRFPVRPSNPTAIRERRGDEMASRCLRRDSRNYFRPTCAHKPTCSFPDAQTAGLRQLACHCDH